MFALLGSGILILLMQINFEIIREIFVKYDKGFVKIQTNYITVILQILYFFS
jgi:hypothetical protein